MALTQEETSQVLGKIKTEIIAQGLTPNETMDLSSRATANGIETLSEEEQTIIERALRRTKKIYREAGATTDLIFQVKL